MTREIRIKKIGNGLEERVDFLHEITTALLDEVKSLGNLKTVEIENGINFDEEIKNFQIQLIERALEKTGGSQSRAARLLNLKLTTLNQKIKRFAIRLTKKQNAYDRAKKQALINRSAE